MNELAARPVLLSQHSSLQLCVRGNQVKIKAVLDLSV